MDIENQVEEFKASLDFDYANEQTLRKIGTWLGIAVDDFDERILRRYMKSYHDLNEKMGTIVLYNVPFAMHCQIVWLNDRGCFDEFCYMDYNSRLMDIQVDDFQGQSCFDIARMV